ncbi:uncharacterized protein FOMMEDRAFT_27477 [Fomitiporia mediterranea MF3/22]|uniref:uncharacterized protein n=1 Tax=Fomitiporia mediterranea (strain MF3/22) TaxID=694068 RepID=UPI0004408013|nr:uncharacterized protein FOMMEDRAFT_27477 [Fomitiporia mediterranea MF3/22]EJD03512.1 hypothetical protein FOMMEDRAFT_27477 [Fomitiporia mediterranea MF3/22]
MPSLLEDLIVAVEGYRLTNYFDVTSFAIYAYDYMLTFEDERSIMWPKRWSLMKVLFFMVRYLPLVDLTITFVVKKLGIMNLGILSAEAILIIRTYAIWNENRSVLILLIGWALANLASSAVFLGLFLKSLGWMRLPPGPFGCLVTSGNGLLAEVWVILMIYESVLIVLLAIKGIQLYKEQGKTPIILALFRDGVVFSFSSSIDALIHACVGAIFYLYIYALIAFKALSVANVAVILTLNGCLQVRGTVGSESGIGIGNNTVTFSFVTEQLEGRESQDLTSLDVSDQSFQSRSGGVEKGVC